MSMFREPADHGFASRAGFTSFDIHFSRFMAGLDGGDDVGVLWAAALLSRAVRAGDSCLNLAAVAGGPLAAEDGGPTLPELRQWLQRLLASKIVGEPGQRRPLILDAGDRFYLYRYWRYERLLADAIAARAARPLADPDLDAFRALSAKYFPARDGGTVDWQKAAALLVLQRHFCVISGGPGTGKTFTIANILALFCDLHRERAPRIMLAAPTGKAAARLKASISTARDRWDAVAPGRECIPDDVLTLHRLLGVMPGTSHCRYHAENPLPADMVVVDEASMVDLAMMSRLVQAVPPEARLILVGDRDQLASVGAGSVLGDICGHQRRQVFSREFRRRHYLLTGTQLPKTPGVAVDGTAMVDTVVELQRNYRFGSDSGIGALSRAVNAGDADRVFDMFSDTGESALNWIDPDAQPDRDQWLPAALLEGYQGYLQAENPHAALQDFQRFQVLCALRKGPFGAAGVNRIAETVLQRSGKIRPGSRSDPRWYHGRPVLITSNDYELQLFNGDIGLVWRDDRHPAGVLTAHFPVEGGGVRQIWPHRLPAHDTVFAMTVHKSQGSEFDHVVLILPPRDNPLLTRELLYTALSRARTRVTLWARRAILQAALSRPLKRSSGLRDALWGAGSRPTSHMTRPG